MVGAWLDGFRVDASPYGIGIGIAAPKGRKYAVHLDAFALHRLIFRLTAAQEQMMSGKSGREFVREVGADLDKWTDEMLVSAANHGHPVEREWLRSWLCDAMQAAQKAMPKTFVTEEPDGDTT